MESKSRGKTRAIAWAALVLAIAAAAVAYASRGDSGLDDGTASQVQGAAPVAGERTIEGRTTCLPHRDASGPQTLECAFGIESAAGQFYAFDSGSLDPAAAASLNSAERVRVTGSIVPIELLSTDYWQRYDVRGILRVDSFEAI